jgi:hypothetical protein
LLNVQRAPATFACVRIDKATARFLGLQIKETAVRVDFCLISRTLLLVFEHPPFGTLLLCGEARRDYPLRISAVGGKLSEVSLYVLSAQALLDKFIFDKSLETLHQRKAERDRTAKERENIGRRSRQNTRSLRLASMMYSLASPGVNARGRSPDWSLEDIEAIGKETWPDTPPDSLDQHSYASPYELAQCQEVKAEKIPQCAKDLPRLKGKNWYLTKQVWTFRPEEMHDLEFQPALPLLAAALPDPAGDAATAALTPFGTNASPVLLAACQSTNALQRINASSGLQALHDPRLIEPLLTLLKDDLPKVRFNALLATAGNWDPSLLSR